MSLVLQFIGGLAFFLYGMSVLGKGLTKLSGGRLEGILARMCRTPVRGVLFGALVTAAIQSSSATTVMVVGFVNAGLMTLRHAVGVIMGANLGTTLTAWILSLSGVSGDNFLLVLLKPESLSPILAAVGTLLWLSSKREKLRDLGAGLVGFGLLFAGMEAMSGAVAPLASNPAFINILMLFQNPLAGLALGALLTAIIQSSSAAVGILQALSGTGAVTIGMAVPIVMGQNIGTCITALLSAVGAEKNARRAAFIHLYFNVAGAIMLLSIFYLLRFLGVVSATIIADETSIALIHTLFNLAATALLLPLSGFLVRFSMWTVREKRVVGEEHGHEQVALLDERFLGSPSFALGLSRAAFHRMCEIEFDHFLMAVVQHCEFSDQREEQLQRLETLALRYEEKLGTYLVKLSATRLSRMEATEVSLLLSALPDAVRIGERARGARQNVRLLRERGGVFSDSARRELAIVREAMSDLIGRTKRLLRKGDMTNARAAEALAGVVLGLCESLRRHHVERLRGAECDPDVSNRFSGLVADLESVADHCKRLTAIGVRRYNNVFDAQRPLRALREVDASFDEAYHRFLAKYRI